MPAALSALSADGGTVSFTSAATNLASVDKTHRDIFVKNLATGAVVLASSSAAGVRGNQDSYDSTLSADGKRVAFTSEAKNLVSGDDPGTTDVFVKDLVTGAVVWSTVGASAQRSAGFDPSLSADGKRVAFTSSATDLVPGDTNGSADVFVKDLVSGKLTRVSTRATGVQAVEGSSAPAISGDGRRVAFASTAPDLVPGDENYEEDVFVKTLSTGAIRLVSTTTGGGQGDGGSGLPAVSQGGRKIAFLSFATNLVRRDTNRAGDVFVKTTD
jgi:Tol biopolymer transport system component